MGKVVNNPPKLNKFTKLRDNIAVANYCRVMLLSMQEQLQCRCCQWCPSCPILLLARVSSIEAQWNEVS